MTDRQHRRWRSRGGAAAAVLVLAVAGAACNGGRDDGSSVAGVQGGQERSGGQPAGATAGPAAAEDATGGDRVAAPLPAGIGAPKVVRTATVAVEVGRGRFGAAFSEVATIAAAHGGFVASSNSSAGHGDDDRLAAGTAVVRVPEDRFDQARRRLSGLGRVRSEELRGEDVGGQLTDLEARLRNLRSQEDAIRLLMARAETIGETIQVQQQLSAVREQVEQLAGQQARLADAAALSTITVSLSEPGAAARTGTERSVLARSLSRAVAGAEAVLAATIVALGYMVPLALLGLAGWVLVRLALRSRRPAPVPAAAPPTA